MCGGRDGGRVLGSGCDSITCIEFEYFFFRKYYVSSLKLLLFFLLLLLLMLLLFFGESACLGVDAQNVGWGVT